MSCLKENLLTQEVKNANTMKLDPFFELKVHSLLDLEEDEFCPHHYDLFLRSVSINPSIHPYGSKVFLVCYFLWKSSFTIILQLYSL